MSFEATISRKKALSAAEAAVEKANELTARHNETIEEVQKIRRGLVALEGEYAKRLDAQLAMIELRTSDIARLERKLGDDVHQIRTTLGNEQRRYVDSADVRLARMIEAHVQMRLIDRLRWLLTGNTPL